MEYLPNYYFLIKKSVKMELWCSQGDLTKSLGHTGENESLDSPDASFILDVVQWVSIINSVGWNMNRRWDDGPGEKALEKVWG